jgi:hypothetical protein
MSEQIEVRYMSGVLPPPGKYIQLVPTGKYHEGVEVMEPRDVTLFVDSLKSAWDKKHTKPRQWVELTEEQVDEATKVLYTDGPSARWRVASRLLSLFKEANA